MQLTKRITLHCNTRSGLHIKIYSWNIYVGRTRLKPHDKSGTRKRNALKRERMEMTGFRCDMCGYDYKNTGRMWQPLPVGHPERNHVHNVRITCPVCTQRVRELGGPAIAFNGVAAKAKA